MKKQIIDAVTNALGWEEDEEFIKSAIRKYRKFNTQELKQKLDDAVCAFEKTGGRGIRIASEIDELRIVLAVKLL